MQCIVLAAGYATRLYPLTKDKPKSLLPVAGKTILEHILAKVNRIPEVSRINLVTNDRFYTQFLEWAQQYPSAKPITVLNDGTTTNENRLGAIADICFAVEKQQIATDILVLAGDNLFDFELTDFASFFYKKNSDCITAHELNSLAELQRTGVVQVDGEARVLSFAEKPVQPQSNLAVPPFYIYKKETVPLIAKYLQEGNNPDAPGNFIPWLIKRKDVFAYQFSGRRYDIGTVASYEQVQRLFAEAGQSSFNPSLDPG